MKRLTSVASTLSLMAAIGAPLALSSTPAAAADVGVSVSISQPGVYGRVDIGRFPQPEVVVQQPVIIANPGRVRPAPVYMWVPPAHQSNWRRYCSQYGACGVPVYFVREQWYDQHVRRGYGDRDRDGIPNRYDRHDDRRAYGDRDRDGVPDRYDRHDDRRDDRGPGRGPGHGPR